MTTKIKATRAIGTDLAKLDAHVVGADEYDDAPELTDEFFDKAEHRIGEKVIRRGRPPEGPGWQSRINASLREHLDKR